MIPSHSSRSARRNFEGVLFHDPQPRAVLRMARFLGVDEASAPRLATEHKVQVA